jgi:hypothetical protein
MVQSSYFVRYVRSILGLDSADGLANHRGKITDADARGRAKRSPLQGVLLRDHISLARALRVGGGFSGLCAPSVHCLEDRK